MKSIGARRIGEREARDGYVVLLGLGLVNGNDILGFVPVNIADNVLHGVLALLGLGTGLLSSRPRREHARTTRAA